MQRRSFGPSNSILSKNHELNTRGSSIWDFGISPPVEAAKSPARTSYIALLGRQCSVVRVASCSFERDTGFPACAGATHRLESLCHVPSSRRQSQPSALRRRWSVVTRMVMFPASIFCTVRGFSSASSASRSCVSPRASRSRRIFAPSVRRNSVSSKDAATPHQGVSLGNRTRRVGA